MSLINEALKRTQNAQQQTASAAPGPALRPVDPGQARAGRGARTLLFIMVAAVVLGNFLLWLAFNDRNRPADSPTKPEAQANTTLPPLATTQPPVEPAPVHVALAPAPIPSTTIPEPAPAPRVVAEAPASAVTTNAPAPEPQVVFAEPPKPTVLRLQSIMYGSRPSAMIAGKFLYVGDSIQGHQVVAIDKATVTLVGQGQTNVLSLP